MFLSKALLFYWFPDPFNSQNHSPGPFDVNIDGIISNFQYWGEKAVLQ